MSNIGSYTIRPITSNETNLLSDWAANEGWNPGLYDAERFRLTDPEGFLIGLVDEEPIACISAVRYGNDYGFIGLYIVHPDYRGQGYGFNLWKQAMKHLENRHIGLDGVVAQQHNYRKSGFNLAYRNIRFQGLANAATGQHSSHPRLSDAAQASFELLSQFDAQHFFSSRPLFLRNWIQPPHKALVYIEGSQLLGFGAIRACRDGHKIGPLFAQDTHIAETLLSALALEAGQGKIILDVPEVNTQGLELAMKFQLSAAFETARMYCGQEPTLPLKQIFGITTFELG